MTLTKVVNGNRRNMTPAEEAAHITAHPSVDIDAIRDLQAQQMIDNAVQKVLLDLFLDIEQRLRLAGQNSTLTDVAAANTKPQYTAVLKTRVKAEL